MIIKLIIQIIFHVIIFSVCTHFIFETYADEFVQKLRPRVKASDVVFMYASNNPGQYDAYDGTIVGWGGRVRQRNENAVTHYKQRVDEAHKRDMRYCASVDFLVDFGGFIDFRPDTFMQAVTRDLDGNPLRVPWLWDHKHKGHPAYWFCTNNPDYQLYLRDQAERACLAPIDGLHIDDYSGSSASSAYNGGCFCPFCMEGFREYLETHYSKKWLKEKGIESINAFDYGDFLRDHDFDAERYKKEHWKCPLIEAFQAYQNEQMLKRITDIYEHAETLRGKPLLRSINSNASSPRTLIPAPVIDYFCGEVNHRAESKEAPLEPVFVYKTVEALGRRQTATASGHDWAWIKAHEKPGLVRLWIAQTYAFGSVFMVPHRQWCYSQEKGTHWWHGKPEDFAYLYQFVQENKKYFDGYHSLADIALIYNQSNYRSIQQAAHQLTKANIPFSILVADHQQLKSTLNKNQLSTYNHVILGEHSMSNEFMDILIDSGAQIIKWKGVDNLPKKVQDQVKVQGSPDIRVSLRYKPGSKNNLFICHVLNQNYDVENDRIEPVRVQISMHKSMFSAKNIEPENLTAKIFQPQKSHLTLPINSNKQIITFEINNVGLWSVIVFGSL